MSEKRKRNPAWEQVKVPSKKNGKIVTTYRKKQQGSRTVEALKDDGFSNILSYETDADDAKNVPTHRGVKDNVPRIMQEVNALTYPKDSPGLRRGIDAVSRGQLDNAAGFDNWELDKDVSSQLLIASHSMLYVEQWERERLSDDKNIVLEVAPFGNMREFGVMYRLKNTETGKAGSWVGCYKHRNSDCIIVNIVNASKFGETVEYSSYGRYGDTKWGYYESFDYQDYKNSAKGVIKLLEDDYVHLNYAEPRK